MLSELTLLEAADLVKQLEKWGVSAAAPVAAAAVAAGPAADRRRRPSLASSLKDAGPQENPRSCRPFTNSPASTSLKQKAWPKLPIPRFSPRLVKLQPGICPRKNWKLLAPKSNYQYVYVYASYWLSLVLLVRLWRQQLPIFPWHPWRHLYQPG